MQDPASQAPLVQPDLPPRLHYRSLSSYVRDLQAEPQCFSYSGPVSHCEASAFKIASSPTIPVRSRDASLTTSLGCCGPTYESACRGPLGAFRSEARLSTPSAAAIPESLSLYKPCAVRLGEAILAAVVYGSVVWARTM